MNGTAQHPENGSSISAVLHRCSTLSRCLTSFGTSVTRSGMRLLILTVLPLTPLATGCSGGRPESDPTPTPVSIPTLPPSRFARRRLSLTMSSVSMFAITTVVSAPLIPSDIRSNRGRFTSPGPRNPTIPAANGYSPKTTTTARSCSTQLPRGTMLTRPTTLRPDGGWSTRPTHPFGLSNPPRAVSLSMARNLTLRGPQTSP